MHINGNQLDILLKNMPPSQRKSIQDIMVGRITKHVKCMSKTCKGRLLAYIYEDGKIVPISEESEGLTKMYLRAYRYRLDGYLGFQCWCGNDSRLSNQEKNVSGIERNAVTRDDLQKVFDNLSKKPAHYPIRDGKQIIDNFLIEEI